MGGSGGSCQQRPYMHACRYAGRQAARAPATHRHGAVHGGDLLARDVVPPHLRQLVAHSLQPVAAEVVQADVAPVVLELAGGGVGSRCLGWVQLCGG